MRIRFDGQSVLVTGAGRGIGRAVAGGFAAAGARVFLADSVSESVQEAAAAIRAAGGIAEAILLDITDRTAVGDAASRIAGQNGPVHHLVNNAGIHGVAGLQDEVSDALWERIIAVNVHGTYNVTRAFSPQLMQTRGTILNIASVMSFIGNTGLTAYSASKAAVHNFTQALSVELGAEGVRVNALAPGLIATPMTEALVKDGERLGRILPRISLQRAGQPADLVGAALFLCSQHAAYITGVTLRVDGGWLAR